MGQETLFVVWVWDSDSSIGYGPRDPVYGQGDIPFAYDWFGLIDWSHLLWWMQCIFPCDKTDDLSLRLCARKPMDWAGRLILTRERVKSTSQAKSECWQYSSHGWYFHHKRNWKIWNYNLPPKFAQVSLILFKSARPLWGTYSTPYWRLYKCKPSSFGYRTFSHIALFYEDYWRKVGQILWKKKEGLALILCFGWMLFWCSVSGYIDGHWTVFLIRKYFWVFPLWVLPWP